MKKKFIVSAVLLFGLVHCDVFSQTILYKNDFENPVTQPSQMQYYDLDSRPVNDLFGGTGTGTSSPAYFDQTYTVETILNHGSSNIYSDPANNGGNYSIGIQNSDQNDLLAIKLMAGNYPYINVKFDISSIALNPTDNGSFSNPNGTAPQFAISFYEAPNWTTNSTVFTSDAGTLDPSIGPQVGSTYIVPGLPASANRYQYNWQGVGFSLPTAGIPATSNPNKKVVMVIDLLGEQYAAFDNFVITADQVALPVSFGAVSAKNINNNLQINWQTLTETNNDHFDIMGSVDGVSFKKLGTVQSLAKDGNATSLLNYSWSVNLDNANTMMSVAVLPFGLLGLLLSRRNKKWILASVMMFGISILSFSCSKNNEQLPNNSQNKINFIKIIQVDKDGKDHSSGIVKAIID